VVPAVGGANPQTLRDSAGVLGFLMDGQVGIQSGSYTQTATIASGDYTALSVAFKPIVAPSIHYVQSANASLVSSLAFPNNNAAGGLLIAVIRGTVTVTGDSAGNSGWALAKAETNIDTVQLWYCPNAIAGANTVNFSGTANQVIIAEYSGIKTASPLVGTPSGATGSGTTYNSGTTTTSSTAPNALLIGAVVGAGVVNQPATFWARNIASTFLFLSDLNPTVAGANAATGTVNSGTWEAAIAAFVGATQPSPPPSSGGNKSSIIEVSPTGVNGAFGSPEISSRSTTIFRTGGGTKIIG